MPSPKLVLCILSVLLLGCSASLRSPSSVTAVLTPPRTLTLWEVSREGGPVSYLFGTCHVGVTFDQALPKHHQKLIAQSSVYVGEMDVEALPDLDDFGLPEGETLSGLVGADQWAEIAEVTDLDDSAEFLNHMHPVFLDVFLAHRLAERVNPGALSMDEAAFRIAAKAKVRREFLETPEQQLAILTGTPAEDWIPYLEKLSDPVYVASLPRQLDDVLQLCRTGDDSLFAKILEQDRKDYPGLAEKRYQQLLVDRNRRWMPRLDALFQKEPTFVAVGAGHMFGNEGLLDLLQERGYVVTQLWGRTEVAPRLVPPEVTKRFP